MKPQIKLGVLIEGTMRPIDTIPAMLREAERRKLNWAKIINDSNGQFEEEDQIGASILNDGKFTPIPDGNYWNGVVGHDGGWTSDEDAAHTVSELIDLLNEDLVGCTFGVQEGDGACLGYWAEPNEDTRGEGVYLMWERKFPGLAIMKRPPFAKEDSIFMQDEDMHKFQMEIGAVDFVWMNDPKNKEGRAFKTIEEHYDAIMDPYLGNE